MKTYRADTILNAKHIWVTERLASPTIYYDYLYNRYRTVYGVRLTIYKTSYSLIVTTKIMTSLGYEPLINNNHTLSCVKHLLPLIDEKYLHTYIDGIIVNT